MKDRRSLRRLAALVIALNLIAAPARAVPYAERSWPARAGLTTAAIVMNIVPLTAVFVAPKCLPGYFFCKLVFAGISAVAAGEHIFFAGATDDAETDAILHRGFGGDWFLTGRHVAGDVTPEPLPDPPATSTTTP